MAGPKTPHRLLTPSPASAAASAAADGEFDESDVWGFGPEDRRKPIPARRSARKKTDRPAGSPSPAAAAAVAASLPVNIPEWSKMVKEENRGFELGGGDEEEAVVIPPHELLCRRREASFSVQEGAGRTLKGRDLSRVRDAIWERTGFED